MCINVQRSSEYQSSGYQSFWRLVPCGLAGLSPFGPPGTLRTDGTQVLLAPRYPGEWRDSVFSATRYPVNWRDSVLSARRYTVDWRDSVLLATRYHLDWWDSVVSVPPGTLWTGGTQSFRPSRNLGTGRHGRTCLPRNVKREKRGLVFVLVFIGLFL